MEETIIFQQIFHLHVIASIAKVTDLTILFCVELIFPQYAKNS